MNIKRSKNAIQFSGDLIYENAVESHKRLLKDISALDLKQTVTMDLANVNEVDSSGVQILLSLFQTIWNHKGTIEVVAISDSLMATIELTGLKRKFKL